MPGPTHRPTHHRPAHHRPGALLAVLVGGVLGTLARHGLSLTLPERSWPVGTLTANLLGALLLGALLEGLSRAGDDTGRRRLVRLALGTGFLGAATTYSALAVEVDLLLRDGRPLLAAAYAGTTVVGGLVLSTLGIALAARRAGR